MASAPKRVEKAAGPPLFLLPLAWMAASATLGMEMGVGESIAEEEGHKLSEKVAFSPGRKTQKKAINYLVLGRRGRGRPFVRGEPLLRRLLLLRPLSAFHLPGGPGGGGDRIPWPGIVLLLLVAHSYVEDLAAVAKRGKKGPV